MADTLNINLKQEDGGCVTIKYNGSNVKTLKLNGTTIWQHKAKKVSSYVQGTFQYMEDDYEWEINSTLDIYELYPDSVGGLYWTNYSFSSSSGCSFSGSRVTDRRNLKTNTWYYLGVGSDWVARIMFYDSAVINGVIGGTDTNRHWSDGSGENEGYYHVVPAGSYRRELMECTKNYTWVID